MLMSVLFAIACFLFWVARANTDTDTFCVLLLPRMFLTCGLCIIDYFRSCRVPERV